jgi:hypothetical protein
MWNNISIPMKMLVEVQKVINYNLTYNEKVIDNLEELHYMSAEDSIYIQEVTV